MKNNRTIRHVKSNRPAARLVHSGQNTTQSLSFSVHLIHLSSSVRPAARLVNSGLNRSQLSSISLCIAIDQHLRLLSMPLTSTLLMKFLLFHYTPQHSTDLKENVCEIKQKHSLLCCACFGFSCFKVKISVALLFIHFLILSLLY